MNAQTQTAVKILRRIKRHLLRQRAKSEMALDEVGVSCVYRTDEGLSCAIGCLIPKHAYRSDAEGVGVRGVTVRGGKWFKEGENLLTVTGPKEQALAAMLNAARIPANETVHHALIRAQDIHDTHPVDKWEAKMDEAIESFAKTERPTLAPV